MKRILPDREPVTGNPAMSGAGTRRAAVFLGQALAVAIAFSLSSAAWSPAIAAEGDEENADEAPAKPAKKGSAKGAAGAEAEEPDVVPTSAMLADPLIRSVVESNPTKPRDLLQTVQILTQVREPALARTYAKRLAAAKLTPAEMDALVDRFGVGLLGELARTPELAKTMGPLVEKLLAGSEAYRTDPERLAKLITDLKSPVNYTRYSAAAELRRAHTAGALALVSALADDKFAPEYPEIAATLVTLADDAIGPVLAGMNSGDLGLMARLIGVAAQLKDPRLSFLLVRPTVDPQAPPELTSAALAALEKMKQSPVDAAGGRLMLTREIERLLGAALRESADPRPEVDGWRWDAATKSSVVARVPRAVEFADRAARLAEDLMAMAPQDPSVERFGLTVRLTAAKLDQDFDAPLAIGPDTAHDAAVAAGAEVVNQVLGAALAEGNALAACAATQILTEIGQPELVAAGGGARSPVSAALASADRRVRFAALQAVMKLAPESRFPGDSDVVKNLGFFINTTGTRRVLIGHPRTDMSRLLAGLLAASGYETDLATTGREFFKLATTSPDYEFALLHISLRNTQADDLLASLRGDYRSANLPIGVLALSMDQKLAARLAAGYPPATSFTEPGSVAVMNIRGDEVLSLVGRYSVPFGQRQREAAAATAWIVELAARSESIFDLTPLVPALILAADSPELRPAATAALVSIGTAAGQRALLDIVDNSTQSIAVRVAAAKSFRESVALHGILLTKSEMEKQYAYYNGSGASEPAVQELFGAVLDTLEDPKAIAVGPPKSPHPMSP